MFCAKTCCEIYRNKRYCRMAVEKEKDGVCDCRHAVYRCQTGDLCFMADICSAASEEAKLLFAYVGKRFAKRGLGE